MEPRNGDRLGDLAGGAQRADLVVAAGRQEGGQRVWR